MAEHAVGSTGNRTDLDACNFWSHFLLSMQANGCLVLCLCLIQGGFYRDMTQPRPVEMLIQGRIGQHSPDILIERSCLFCQPIAGQHSASVMSISQAFLQSSFDKHHTETQFRKPLVNSCFNTAAGLGPFPLFDAIQEVRCFADLC